MDKGISKDMERLASFAETIEKGRVLNRELIKRIHRYGMDNQVMPTACLINPFTYYLIASYYYLGDVGSPPIEDFNISGVKFIRTYDIEPDSFVLLGIQIPLIK